MRVPVRGDERVRSQREAAGLTSPVTWRGAQANVRLLQPAEAAAGERTAGARSWCPGWSETENAPSDSCTCPGRRHARDAHREESYAGELDGGCGGVLCLLTLHGEPYPPTRAERRMDRRPAQRRRKRSRPSAHSRPTLVVQDRASPLRWLHLRRFLCGDKQKLPRGQKFCRRGASGPPKSRFMAERGLWPRDWRHPAPRHAQRAGCCRCGAGGRRTARP